MLCAHVTYSDLTSGKLLLCFRLQENVDSENLYFLCCLVLQVCCSGHGKNGALCVLRQSIRPEMITEVCHDKFVHIDILPYPFIVNCIKIIVIIFIMNLLINILISSL